MKDVGSDVSEEKQSLETLENAAHERCTLNPHLRQETLEVGHFPSIADTPLGKENKTVELAQGSVRWLMDTGNDDDPFFPGEHAYRGDYFFCGCRIKL